MKKKIFLLLAVVALLAVLFFPLINRVNASGGNLTAESILPENYRDNGDTSRFLFDPRFSTMTGSTILYQNNRIYIQLYNCSYTGIFNYRPENYIVCAYIRKSDGNFIWLNQVDREAMLNDWSCVQRVGPVDVHKTYDYAPVEIEGASPLKPRIAFSDVGAYGERVTFAGSCDWSKTSYSFDYYAINKKTGKQSYVADEYTMLRADDYLTGFYYCVDTNRGDTPYSASWKKLSTSDTSGDTKSLSDMLSQEVVSCERDYYVHVVSKSYTGHFSSVSTAKIPKRGVHRVRYDLNGGEGSIAPQTKCYGRELELRCDVPKKAGYTFVEWKGASGESYEPGSKYSRDQNGGEYVLSAVWKKNTYTFMYDGNSKDGRNGKVTGEMAPETKYYDSKGLSGCEFENETKDDFGFNKYSFTGWSLDSDDKYPLVKKDDVSRCQVSDLIDKQGLKYTDGGKITLYAVWDEEPVIENAKDRYITDEEAKSVTEESLLEGVTARDREDGVIQGLSIRDFSRSDFEIEGKRKAVELEINVKDSAGNVGRKKFRVWVISSSAIKDNDGASEYVRFIDGENYDKNDPKGKKAKESGGLIDDSIWYWEDSYRKAFNESRKETVIARKKYDYKALRKP